MSQFDYILKFASFAAAKADPQIRENMDALRTLFATDRVIPNLKVWRASQNTFDTVDGPDGPVQVVGHNYLTGYYLLISLPRRVAALENHAAVQIVIDRDKSNARQAGGVVRSTVGAAILQDIRFEPVFLGSNPPWGAMT